MEIDKYSIRTLSSSNQATKLQKEKSSLLTKRSDRMNQGNLGQNLAGNSQNIIRRGFMRLTHDQTFSVIGAMLSAVPGKNFSATAAASWSCLKATHSALTFGALIFETVAPQRVF